MKTMTGMMMGWWWGGGEEEMIRWWSNTWAALVRWAPRPLLTLLCSFFAPPLTMIIVNKMLIMMLLMTDDYGEVGDVHGDQSLLWWPSWQWPTWYSKPVVQDWNWAASVCLIGSRQIPSVSVSSSDTWWGNGSSSFHYILQASWVVF